MSRKLNAYNMYKKCLTLPIICDIMALPLKGSFFLQKNRLEVKRPYGAFRQRMPAVRRFTLPREAFTFTASVIRRFRVKAKNISVKREVPL